jgi:hypothetical protein
MQAEAAHFHAFVKPVERTSSDLFGILTDTTAAGTVQVVFAGISCIFR